MRINLQGTDLKNKRASTLLFKIRTFAMIKPDSYLNIGRIINCVEEAGFTIGNLKMAKMSRQEAELFYSEHKGKPFFDALVDHMSSDLVVGL